MRSPSVAVEEAFGAIDVWVNNAMVSVFSPVKDMRPEEFKRVTEVTYLGFVYGTMAALRRMLPRDRGVIVQVGSALAYRAHPAAGGLLRSEARDQGIHRLAPLRADPRRQRGAAHDGASAGAEHAAVLVGEEPPPPAAAARAADLPARSGGRGGRLGGASPAPGAARRTPDRGRDLGQRHETGGRRARSPALARRAFPLRRPMRGGRRASPERGLNTGGGASIRERLVGAGGFPDP